MQSCHRRFVVRPAPTLACLLLLVPLLFPAVSSAQTILDLGAETSVPNYVLNFFSGLEGTPIDGREITSEFVFTDHKFLEVESSTLADYNLIFDLAFIGTHSTGEAGPGGFSGWVEDRAGNRTDGVEFQVGSGGGVFGYQLAFSGMPAVSEIHRVHFTVTLPDIPDAVLTDTQYFAVTPSGGGQVSVRSLEVLTADAVLGLEDGQQEESLFLEFPGGIGETPINGQILDVEVSFLEGRAIEVREPNYQTFPRATITLQISGTHGTSVAPQGAFEGTMSLTDGQGELSGIASSTGGSPGTFSYRLLFDPNNEVIMKFTSLRFRAQLPVIPGATLNDALSLVVTPDEGQVIFIGTSVGAHTATWGEVKAQFDR